MSKIAVVYWSGTGNTEAMAAAVAEGAREKGADVTLITATGFFCRSGGQLRRHRLWLPFYGSGTTGGKRV